MPADNRRFEDPDDRVNRGIINWPLKSVLERDMSSENHCFVSVVGRC
jgi:hypothetical protein